MSKKSTKKSSCNRKINFTFDVEKVKKILEERDIRDSDFSRSIGKKRGWFFSKKGKKNCKVTLEIANQITEVLGCKLQDISAEDETISNPVGILYECKAEYHFRALVSKYPAITAELLSVIDGMNPNDLNSIICYAQTIIRNKKENENPPDEDWWKSFYTLSIMYAVDQIEMAPSSKIQERYFRNLSNRLKENLNYYEEFELKKSIMVGILKKELDKLSDEEYLSFGKDGKQAGKILDLCAYNLIQAIERRDPPFTKKLNQIKSGDWKPRNLISEIPADINK